MKSQIFDLSVGLLCDIKCVTLPKFLKFHIDLLIKYKQKRNQDAYQDFGLAWLSKDIFKWQSF